jgi:hypothetical protein
MPYFFLNWWSAKQIKQKFQKIKMEIVDQENSFSISFVLANNG